MKRSLQWLLTTVVPPLTAFALVLGVWHFATTYFKIKRYILPSPALVWNAACESADQLWSATLLTGIEAVSGFSASLILGILTACVFSQSRMIRTSLFPYAVFLQTVPIVAIAPLIVIWFGFGMQSVILISIIVSLFPIITNTTAGLLGVDPDLLDLFRLNNATRLQTLWKLRLPGAVPSIITGARISSGVAVIGAIVGEFFAGSGNDRQGLGYLIYANKDRSTDKLFATVIASTLLGLVIFSAVSSIGAFILRRWYDDSRDTRT